MNRRNFLTALVAIPAMASVLPSLAAPAVKKIQMSTMYGRLGKDPLEGLHILSENDILKNGFTLLLQPCFKENGTNYVAKTWRLKTCCDGQPDKRAISGAKELVLFEIVRLQLTHLMYVAFNPSPIVMHDGSYRYAAFVRGCRLKPWSPWEHDRLALSPFSYDAKSA